MNLVDPYINQLVEIARAYYLENQTQAEIARSLGISRSLVSRHLATARRMGIVEIRIVAPEETFNELKSAFRERFPHLREIVVAPSFSDDDDALRAMIGRFAANYLLEILKPRQILALGCGRTLREMVDALSKTHIPGSIIVQAMGNIGHEAHKLDYNEIARHAAEMIGGKAYYVSAPAILGTGSGQAADLIESNVILKHALSMAKAADIFVVGIGSIESDQLYVRSGLIMQNEFDTIKAHAVGDICAHFFDIEGQEQTSPFADRAVGVNLSDLRRAQYAVGVAGGKDKVAPILGALRGKLINVLVSDEKTITHVLELDKST